jgi:hypothetical protein
MTRCGTQVTGRTSTRRPIRSNKHPGAYFSRSDTSGHRWPDAPVNPVNTLLHTAPTLAYVSRNLTHHRRVRSRPPLCVRSSSCAAPSMVRTTRLSCESGPCVRSHKGPLGQVLRHPGNSDWTCPVKSRPASSHVQWPPFLFLTPQPLHPCFQVANQSVYNSCAHVLAF